MVHGDIIIEKKNMVHKFTCTCIGKMRYMLKIIIVTFSLTLAFSIPNPTFSFEQIHNKRLATLVMATLPS